MRIIVAVLLAGMLGGQQPGPIQVNVRLVQVSVIARNSAGVAIRDLTADDFEILDNGKAQIVRFFCDGDTAYHCPGHTPAGQCLFQPG
jgi:glyoxylase-like metal-dependent hydrolase (beta-lactamase superfamily II)